MAAKYNTTATSAVTPTDNAPAFLITCDCPTHPKGMNKALVRAGAIAPTKAKIHGNIVLAHSPAGKLASRMPRANVWAA